MQLRTFSASIEYITLSTDGSFLFTIHKVPGPSIRDATGPKAWRGAAQIWRRDREHWTELGHQFPMFRLADTPMVVFQRSDFGVYVAGSWSDTNSSPYVALRSADMALSTPSESQRLSAEARPRVGIRTSAARIAASDDGTRIAVATYSGVFVCAVPSLEVLSTLSLPGWRPFRPFRQPLVALDVYDLRFMPDSYGFCLTTKRSYSHLPASARPRVWMYVYDPEVDIFHEVELEYKRFSAHTWALSSPTGQRICVADTTGDLVYSSKTGQVISTIPHHNRLETLTFAIPRAQSGSHILRVSKSEMTLWDLSSGQNVLTVSTNGGHTVSGTVNMELLASYFSDTSYITSANVDAMQQLLPLNAVRENDLRRITRHTRILDFGLVAANKYTAVILFVVVEVCLIAMGMLLHFPSWALFVISIGGFLCFCTSLPLFARFWPSRAWVPQPVPHITPVRTTN
jgi:hypothetical protein